MSNIPKSPFYNYVSYFYFVCNHPEEPKLPQRYPCRQREREIITNERVGVEESFCFLKKFRRRLLQSVFFFFLAHPSVTFHASFGS